MQLLDNVLTREEIAVLKNYYNKNHEKSYVNGYGSDWHPMADVSNYIDKRLLIVNNSEAGRIIERMVHKIFPGEQYIWTNYQRQALPHTVHMDEYGRDRLNPTWTIVIAVDDEPRFKTLLFKEKFNSCHDLDSYLIKCAETNAPFLSDISGEQDIEHMKKDRYEHNLCNYLTFEGAFTYAAGSAILFDTNQAHCTSNWRKYPDIQYRDLVQIHIGAVSATSYIEEEHTKKGDRIPDMTEMQGIVE